MAKSKIRKATFSDIPVLCELLREAYTRSRFRGASSFSEARTKAMLMNAIQRDGGNSEGSIFFAVSDRGERDIDAFIIGIIQSLYLITDKLEATDLFWYAKEGADATSAKRLLRVMHKWAATCPNVVLLRQGNTDAITSRESSGRVLKGSGMRLTGNIYEKDIQR